MQKIKEVDRGRSSKVRRSQEEPSQGRMARPDFNSGT